MNDLDKKTKVRTAITIDPDLWDEAKAEAANASPKKLSFSALVELALKKLLAEKKLGGL